MAQKSCCLGMYIHEVEVSCSMPESFDSEEISPLKPTKKNQVSPENAGGESALTVQTMRGPKDCGGIMLNDNVQDAKTKITRKE